MWNTVTKIALGTTPVFIFLVKYLYISCYMTVFLETYCNNVLNKYSYHMCGDVLDLSFRLLCYMWNGFHIENCTSVVALSIIGILLLFSLLHCSFIFFFWNLFLYGFFQLHVLKFLNDKGSCGWVESNHYFSGFEVVDYQIIISCFDFQMLSNF